MATKFEKLMRGFAETRSSWDAVFLRNVGREQLDHNVMDSPYTKSDLVYTCVSTTARAISQVPLLRYEQRGKDEYEPVYTDDPWQSLLENPNPLMDGYRFKEAITSFYLLDGNVFVVPFPPVSMGGVAGVPESLYVVGQDYMKPRRDERTGQLDGWTYQPRGENHEGYPLEGNEVLHFSTWNPEDMIMGMSPLEAGGLHVKVDYKASIFNEKFFDNAAVPAGMITTPPGVGFGDKKKERLKAELESQHSGYRRAFRLMFLEKGLKYEKIGATHQEMMFKDLRQMSRESIMQAFGMKKAVISVTEDLNYATAESQKKAWWEDTLLPIMSMMSNGFTHFIMGPDATKMLNRKNLLVSMYGRQKGLERMKEEIRDIKAKGKEATLKSHFDFDTSGVKALQDDFDKKVETATKLARMGFTTNEINQRLELGFDENKPWRDSWWVQQTFTPIGEDFGEEPEEPEAPPEEPPTEEPPEEEPPPAEVQPASPAGGKELKIQGQQGRFTDRMSPIEARYQSKIERFFWEIRKKSLRHLLKYHDPVGLMQEEFDEETKNLVKWVTPLYREAMAAGIRSASEEVVEALAELDERKRGIKEKGLKATFSIDVDFLMDNDPEVLSYLMDRVDLIGIGKRQEGQLTKTVRRQIVEELHKGQEAAEGISELADRIKGKLKGNTSRAKTIARTETISAANHGRNMAFKRSGFTKKVWITAGDQEVRDTHRAVEARGPINMDESWQVGGCSLRYPSDYGAGCPGETINCRCTESVDPESHPAFQEPSAPLVPDKVPGETVPKGEAIGGKVEVSNRIRTNKAKLQKIQSEVANTIDGIHGDGDLDPVALGWLETGHASDGTWIPRLKQIKLNRKPDHPHMTLTHEMGHWLDFTGLRGAKKPKGALRATFTDEKDFAPFFKAVHKTDTWKRFKEGAGDGSLLVMDARGKQTVLAGIKDYCKYLMEDHEVWARAYSQYIAKKSKNKFLLKELDHMRKSEALGWGMWSDEEFGPIYEAIDNLFKTKGWIE